MNNSKNKKTNKCIKGWDKKFRVKTNVKFSKENKQKIK